MVDEFYIKKFLPLHELDELVAPTGQLVDLSSDDLFLMSKVSAFVDDDHDAVTVSKKIRYGNIRDKLSSDFGIAKIKSDIIEISGNLNDLSGKFIILSGRVDVISSNLNIVSSNLNIVSSHVNIISSNLNVVSSNLNIVSGNLNDLSDKFDDYSNKQLTI